MLPLARKLVSLCPDWTALMTSSSPEISFPALCASPNIFDNFFCVIQDSTFFWPCDPHKHEFIIKTFMEKLWLKARFLAESSFHYLAFNVSTSLLFSLLDQWNLTIFSYRGANHAYHRFLLRQLIYVKVFFVVLAIKHLYTLLLILLLFQLLLLLWLQQVVHLLLGISSTSQQQPQLSLASSASFRSWLDVTVTSQMSCQRTFCPRRPIARDNYIARTMLSNVSYHLRQREHSQSLAIAL